METSAPGVVPNEGPQPETEMRHPENGRSPEGRVFEVFTQPREGKAFEHSGNIVAPDAEMAILYAREFYARRQESYRLWVVPREAIVEIDDQDLLHPPAVDRSYRTVGGYSVRDTLRATRGAVAGSQQPD
ncbi:MAG: phenylacetic acid degradation protein PaaB [Chloroflexota bacterium]|nr:phenylacetic acid degradation protein PaaB [Chloroflexota bacterium]